MYQYPLKDQFHQQIHQHNRSYLENVFHYQLISIFCLYRVLTINTILINHYTVIATFIVPCLFMMYLMIKF